MTERLLETGRRILEQSHRLTLLPRQHAISPAYLALLQDPTDLLANAWSPLLSTPDSAAVYQGQRPTERHARHGLTEPLLFGDLPAAPKVFGSSAVSVPYKRQIVQPQPSPAPPRQSRPERPVPSRLPLALVSGGIKQPASNMDDNEPSGDLTQNVQRGDIPFPTRGNSSLPPGPAPLPPASLSSRDFSSNTIPAAALSSSSPEPAADAETRVTVSEEKESSSSGARWTPSAATTVRVPAVRRQEAVPIGRSGVGDVEANVQAQERSPFPSSNLTWNRSGLARVLNANLSADTGAPPPQFDPEPRASPLADDQSASFRAPNWTTLEARDSSPFHSLHPPGSDRWENHQDDHRSAQGHSGQNERLVEDLLDELYERLRLEFLRTYGTSGE